MSSEGPNLLSWEKSDDPSLPSPGDSTSSDLLAATSSYELHPHRQGQLFRNPDTLAPRRVKTSLHQRFMLSPESSTGLSTESPSFLWLPRPRNLSDVSSATINTIGFILSQYERLVDVSFFKPNGWQLVGVPKIFQTVLDGADTRMIGGYTQWILKFERQLNLAPEQSLASNNLSNLIGTLELAHLKLKFVHVRSPYRDVHDLAPVFLQVAFADSSLWPDIWSSTSVSLAHIFASSRYELGHFVLLDSFCSLAYALPQAIEYDTSVSLFDTNSHPVEWVHGCPIEFQFILVELNARCNNPSRPQPDTDWRNIEHRIQSWKSKAWPIAEEESWKTIARMALQESWRHTLLIYLYMGVCGVASDDQRVQASVRQVFRLIETLKETYIPLVNIYILMQYLVAGICARSESQRAIVREGLGSTFDDAVWILKGSDFVPVLDHLWHDAAANGQPVRWSDYAYSRSVMLPAYD
ncbi:Fungal specific transcription factor domain [Ceratobasidium sp. AG-Ba]|nr:Fungal specific transcription factor domain [Ceratobasidium sp. AG-Ba]